MASARDVATWLHGHAELAMVPLLLVLGMVGAGFAFAVSPWAFLVLLAAVSVAIRWSFRRWPGVQTGGPLHARLAIQAFGLMLVTYSTGWGAALSLIFVFVVSENVRESGSSTARLAFDWSVFAIAVAQLGIQLGWFPSTIEAPAVHGVAVMGSLVLGVLVGRIHLLTAGKELAEAAARASETRFRSLVAHSSDIILVIGTDRRISYVSSSVAPLLRYREDDLLDHDVWDLIHPDDRPRVEGAVSRMLRAPGERVLIECRIHRGDGVWVTVESHCQNLSTDETVGGFVVNARDISDRKALEAELQHRAFHDSLTGLANRYLFHDRLEHALVRSTRHASTFGLLFIDLDGFKTVNDTFGHATGDHLLQTVAARIRLSIRETDTAARLGGDEFALLLEDLPSADEALQVADRLLELVRAPIEVGDSTAHVAASIGVVIVAEDGATLRTVGGDPSAVSAVSSADELLTADVLLRNADIAMYAAKSNGKDRYEVFLPEMHGAVVERQKLEQDLRLALTDDQFEVYYQPIVDLQDQRIVGLEALLRWQHPDRGLLGPASFIPLAEETGLIVPLGDWVLREATRQVAGWNARYRGEGDGLSLSVNVSPRQLSHPALTTTVQGALDESGLVPAQLVLEITESGLVVDATAASGMLTELKQLGVRLAVDDFGTGYSSLSYLQNFPLDIIKIDRTFVEGLLRGSHSPALVSAIVGLGRSLDLATVAEGIERADQLDRFRELDCTYGQGYLFARPAPADELEAQLRAARSVTVTSDTPRPEPA